MSLDSRHALFVDYAKRSVLIIPKWINAERKPERLKAFQAQIPDYHWLLNAYLDRVSEQRRCPALGQTTGALLLQRHLEAIHQVLVLGRVHLQAALDQIQRRQQSVRGT